MLNDACLSGSELHSRQPPMLRSRTNPMIESKRFQNGSLSLVKNKTTPDTWFLRYYEEAGEKRVYRRKRIGTVREFPHRRDAEKAVLSIRGKINDEVGSPQTVDDLLAHYQKHELTPARKAFASIENHLTLSKCHIAPRWGSYKLGAVRTVQVEEWLDSLSLAPASKTKIKSAFSVLYSHAIRHEWVSLNPISKVRTSSKRLREKDVLTPEEFRALLEQLSIRDRAMVLLIGSTGVRRSELMGLIWTDVDMHAMEVSITRSCVRNRFGDTKTECSRRPVPLHPLILESLLDWRSGSLYKGDGDFLFPSIRLNGNKPLSPDSLLKKSIRPALKRAGIEGKIIGWHNFRHTLGTLLRSIGTDIKVAQDLLRHANSRTTLDIYTHAVSQLKRDANTKVVELLLPGRALRAQHLSAPSPL
jgi:integrase